MAKQGMVPKLRMSSVSNLEARLKAVEDRLEIQELAARFSDAVNESDVTAFAQLWASDRPIWEIGRPCDAEAAAPSARLS